MALLWVFVVVGMFVVPVLMALRDAVGWVYHQVVKGRPAHHVPGCDRCVAEARLDERVAAIRAGRA